MFDQSPQYHNLLSRVYAINDTLECYSWTSDDAEERAKCCMNALRQLSLFTLDADEGINECKAYLNDLRPALEKELIASRRWTAGHGYLSTASGYVNHGVGKLTSIMADSARKRLSERETTIQVVINEIHSILNEY